MKSCGSCVSGDRTRPSPLRVPLLLVAVLLLAAARPSAQPPTSVYFFDDIEGDTSGWSTYSLPGSNGNVWPVTADVLGVHSPTHAWGTFFAPNTRAVLLSPPIDLRSAVHPILHFWHKWNFEDFIDGGIVNVLDDGGVLHTEHVYMGGDGNWRAAAFDLTPFVGSASLKVAFQIQILSTLPGVWEVDDVEVLEAQPPAALGKIAPANGAILPTITTNIGWEPGHNTDAYEYCADTTNNNSCDGTWAATENLAAPLPGLSPNTTYWWQVRARNDIGTTEANGGTWWSFTTPGPPEAFVKSAPGNGATGQLLSLTLSWAPSAGATGYQYCIDTTHNSECNTSWTSTAGTSVSFGALSIGTTYSWQVRAVNGAGAGTTEADGGIWWAFTTGVPPDPFAKAHGATPAAPTLTWNASSGAASYEYCVDTTGNNVCDGPWTSTAATSVALGALAHATSFWQVRALNNIGVTEADGGTWWSMHGTITGNDFDGDGRTGIAVFRPSSGGWYYLKSSTNNTTSAGVSWGLSTDQPVPGDYDGDGKTDPAIYRASTGLWAMLKSSTNYGSAMYLTLGLGGNLPMPADYDGDGKADPALFTPSTGTWYAAKSSADYLSAISVSWGLCSDQPMPGDYDGDGKTDPAVFRPSTGGWYVLKSSTDYTTSLTVFWGLSTDLPVPGDFDGDGRTDPSVFRATNGFWYSLRSSTNYSNYLGVSWGLSSDTPVPGDFDGDGKIDPTVFRSSTGFWYSLRSSVSYSSYLGVAWGLSTDVPLGRRP